MSARQSFSKFILSAILALLLQAALWGSRFLKFAIEHYMSQRRETDPALATTVSALSSRTSRVRAAPRSSRGSAPPATRAT